MLVLSVQYNDLLFAYIIKGLHLSPHIVSELFSCDENF